MRMWLDDRRLVLVLVPAGEKVSCIGTGYVITSELVLTARHIWFDDENQTPPPSGIVRFTRDPEQDINVTLCWDGSDNLDVCLLQFAIAREVSGILVWGKFDRSQWIEWESGEFPAASEIDLDDSTNHFNREPL